MGINLLVFHRYAHQPWLDRKPGMVMGHWGMNFERTNTWWNQGSAWIDYITRCQSLLQQGRFQADLCYFYGEGAPLGLVYEQISPAVPKGFDYDVCNADILLNLMQVKDGRITTPSGMSYRVLVLPPGDRMTLPVLQRSPNSSATGRLFTDRSRCAPRACPAIPKSIRKSRSSPARCGETATAKP